MSRAWSSDTQCWRAAGRLAERAAASRVRGGSVSQQGAGGFPRQRWNEPCVPGNWFGNEDTAPYQSATPDARVPRSHCTGYASEPKSSIVAIGLSVHTAPVEIREKLAIAEAHWPEAIAQLCAYPHVEEAAVLSTCNRMEIYCVVLSYNRGVREVEEFLAKVCARPNAP